MRESDLSDIGFLSLLQWLYFAKKRRPVSLSHDPILGGLTQQTNLTDYLRKVETETSNEWNTRWQKTEGKEGRYLYEKMLAV